MKISETLGTLDELAERLGSRDRALELLDSLSVPIVCGAYSVRLLLRNLETAGISRSDRPKPIELLEQALRTQGVHLQGYRSGRPTTAELIAEGHPVVFGFSDSPTLGPVTISTDSPTQARVYSCATRTRGKASFTISGFGDPEGPPLYLFALLDEGVTWGMTKGEVAWVAEQLSSGIRGELARNFVAHTRPGALRAAFPKAPNDWLLDGRMEPLRDGSS